MRKSSKARLFSTCLTGAVLAASSPAWGQTSDAPVWKPRAEAEAQAGKDIGVSTSLFAPIAQNDSSLVYVDGRIGYDQRFDRNGSATVGARFRTGEDTAIGVNVGADFYRSDIGSRDQAAVSMGLEGFSSVFDVRVNYRLPLSKVQTIGFIDPNATTGAAALVLENNRLIERRSGFRLEAIPLQGFNGEAGVRLPVGDNASIRGSVGGFDYWDRKADESYRGVRGGLELDIEDRDSGFRFTFGGVVEHDNRFGTDARAHVRLSIPFGGRAGDRGAAPTGLDRQMGDRVRRDYVARSGSRFTDLTSTRFAVDARTGNQFGGFYYASGTGTAGAAGTLVTPTTIGDAVSRAGTNGVVVALGSGGNISTAGVTLATDQYLVGGASAVDVRLIDGSTVQYALGGTNGVVVGTNAAGAAVTLGQGSVIRDATVRGAGAGIAANGVGGFAIERTIVENTGGAGIALTNTLGNVALTGLTVRGGAGAGVLVTGGSSVSLANSTISGGAGAVDINDGGANLTTSLSNLTLSATGGNVLDIDGSGAGTVTVAGLSGITIRGGTGETGGLSVRSATFAASAATAGIQTVNAGRMEVGTSAARVNGQGVFLTDVTGSLSFADLDIANSGATGLRVVNSKANSFTLATLDGTIDTVGGTAADLDPLVINLNFATVASSGAAGPGVILNTVEGGGTGGNALTIGTLTVSNSGGDGLVILNSTGLVRVNGGSISNSGGNSVQIGEQGVAGSGGSVNLIFAGSITDASGAAPIVAIFNARGTINFTGPISGSGGILVEDTLAGSAISFGAIALTGTAGNAISLDRLAGSINFAGLVTITNPGANGIVIGTVPGGVTFGDVDITGLGNFNGVDVRNTHGTVLFNTLDISGTGAGTGINVTGSTNAGNVMTIAGSVIQGVNIGVDLTQASMTGQFRFGDGSATPMNSTIAANIPIVIALMNASVGSYNFADANLVGDTSNLTGAGFTAYYAMVGATGAGTRSDPGSLAGADASTAQYIVLLNNPAGGQDVFDAADAGGSFDLGAGQSLVSFLASDFFAVSGAGVPANLTVSGIGPAGILNPYANSGAAALTTSTAGAATINLANNSTIDGLVIRNAGGDVGVEGSGVSNVRIQNSDISGATGAIAISDGGATSSVQLTHLDLASAAGTTLALSGAGAGTLTVSGADIDIAATGSSAALSLVDVTSGGLGFGAVSTGTSATDAVTAQNVTGGNLVFGSIATSGTAAGAGVSISGSSSAVVVQSINASGTAGDAVTLTNNSGAITIGSISVSGSGADAVELTGNGAVTIGALTASGVGGAGLNIQDSHGAITIAGGAISGAVTGVSIDGVDAGTGVSIGSLNLGGISGSGIALADVDGSVLFTGTTNIAGIGTSGIVFGAGSAGSITFGDVNIIGLGAGRTGVDARTASGTISFNTLDITGISTTGTRGIDLRGATFAGSFATVDSGSITGVAIGVDLTNAAITGSFRDGDGSNTDADGAASTISAVVPIEIAGLNGAVGTYNFADVNLVGDTSQLVTSATTYYVAAGATGAGTLSDPGNLAGAEASGAQVIVLLNNPAGGQDTLDSATAGGSFDLAAGQWLLSFLNGDTLMLPGGGPANVVLFGITPGQIVNPFAGSGAPILTNSTAASALVLASNVLIDGIVIDAPNGIGVIGQFANTTIRNSNISAGSNAILIVDAAADTSVSLTNLRLSSASGAVLNLDGTNAGTLTVTALDDVTILGGNGEGAGLFGDSVVFDADLATAGLQTVSGMMTIGTTSARVGGAGVYLANVQGDLGLALDLASEDTGVDVSGGAGGFRFAISSGTIDVANGVAYGLLLSDLSADVVLSSLVYSGTGNAVGTHNVASIGPAGRALDIGSLSVADGAAVGITMTGSATGSFSFGAGSSIGTTIGAAVQLSNSGASTFNYLGNVNYAGADALLHVSGGHSGAVNFGSGTLTASSGLGLFFQNADGAYTFGGATNLETGISITSGSSGTFVFGADTAILNPAGIAIDIQDSTAAFAYAGSIAYSGGAAEAINVINHSGGVIGFTGGPISITTGTGIRFINADGNYSFAGATNMDAGAAGILITGGSAGTFLFGAGTSIINSGGAAIEVSNSTAAVGYAGYLSATGGNGIRVVDHGAGQLDFQNATLDLAGGTTLSFDNADGTYLFGSFATAGGSGISVLNDSFGNFHFYDVDIADVGAGQTAVNLTGATGFITFETLDITGIDPTGSKGIDLTGSTTAANIIVNESSTITGVGIGVDLTNAAITGVFRFGDGSNTDADGAASLIDAVTPLVITGVGAGGTYNFLDVVLTGDTSALNTNRTLFWVQAGAAGAGTRTDPGSLAAAEASGADVIILLDTQVAGQDLIDGASAGGGLDLAVNQSLLSFLNGDTLSVGGGAPANILLFGIGGGTVTNPYAGSGAPLLTTTQAGATTVNLASGALIDGVQIGNLDWKGVFGGGVTGATIRNSVIHGGVNAIQVIDNGGTADVALSNLALSSNTGDVLSLVGSGGGQLTVTQLTGITIAGGNSGAGFYSEDVLFDADLGAGSAQTVVGTLNIGNSGSRVGGSGLVLDGASGALSLATTIFNTDGDGIFADGGGAFSLAITGGAINTGPVAASGSALNLSDLSADIQLASITYTGPDSGVIVNNVTGNGAGGRALDVGTLTVASGGASGIFLGGTTNGNFSFGGGSSITGTTVAGIELANTGAGDFSYAGSVTGVTSGALISAHNGDIGNATFGGTLSATGGAGLQFDNADGSYYFTGTTTLNGGDAGIDILGGSGGSFEFGTGTSITSPSGIGINVQNSAAAIRYEGSLTYATAGTAAINFVNHSAGLVTFGALSTLDITNGTGIQFDNADGGYAFNGVNTLNGGDVGIDIVNGSTGGFLFGSGTSLVSPTGTGINIANSAVSLTYYGDLTYATAGQAALSVVGHASGTIYFQGGTLDITNGTGLQFDNADGDYNFQSAMTLNGGDAGIDIVNGSAGNFTFDAGTSITSPSGTGINIAGSTGSISYRGNLTYATAGQAAVSIVNHSGGAVEFRTGTISVTNGTGVRFDNADGTYSFMGTTTLNGSAEGIRIANGSSGTFTFDAGTSVTATLNGLTLAGSTANVIYTGTLIGNVPGGGAVVEANADQSTLDLVFATLNVTNGLGLTFDNADGTYNFGSFALSGGARISAINGSNGAFTFGNVDITGLGANQTAVNLTGATGNVTFNTLDITGASTVGTKGIDLTGNTGAGNIVTTNSGTITGVAIGVDLTNASRPGLFRYGDGSVPVGSTISATTPLVITGLNGGSGTYNFADVNLIGDTSALATSATVYYVLAGATGTGTLADPGSLAGAELATVDFIILLNDPAGGQDVLDAVGTNGNDTLALDPNQALRSFRDSNTIALPGGAPVNVILTGVVTGQVTNRYAASAPTASDRAPILTTTGAANTVTLANNSGLDGVFVQSAVGNAAVFGSGVSGVTLSNATLSGAGGGLSLVDGGAAASATLTNLTVSVTSANAALGLSGAGAGTLTVAGTGVNVSQGGAGSLLTIADVAIGGAGLGFGNVTSTASGAGIDLGTIGGAGTLSFASITVAGATGAGVSLHDSSAIVNLGNVTVSGAAGAGIALTSNSGGTTTIGTVVISTSNTGIAATGLTNTLNVGSGTIDGASVAGIVFGAGNTGALNFGDINVTGVPNGARGVDARQVGAANVTFATLDITGASATGTRGIDLTGATGAGDFIVTNGSAISGVGIGVDLTNASRTGLFQYGDGNPTPLNSSITATTPIEIVGLNGGAGIYNFLDVQLNGDTTPLEVSAFFVRAGATGVGSAADPGSLAAADASGATYIVLLDSQAGAAFDTISGTIDLADGQSLVSFLNGPTLSVTGGAPSNVQVSGITSGSLTHALAGSGAPLLTSADATGTVRLGGTSILDGVVISNSGTGAGVFANGTAGTATLRNSTISGGGAAVDLRSGAATRIVNLQNLTLANTGNQAGALLNVNGTGGTLTVTGMSNLTIGTAGGETAGLVFDTVTFDSDASTGAIDAVLAGALTIGTTGARVQGDGLSLTNVSGSLTFSDLDIANNGGTGLLVANSKANSFLLTTADGSIDTINGTAVNLDPLKVEVTMSSVSATNGAYGIQLDQVEGFFTVTGAVNVTNATVAGIAIENNTGQTDALDATFNGAVTINNTVGAGLSLTNNAGATIAFAGGGTGVDVVTTGGAALTASGGTLSFAGAGNSLTSGTGTTLALNGITVGASGINFASVSATGAAAGVVLTSVTAAIGGTISLGTVSLQGITSRGIDVSTALGAALTIADLDIGLANTAAVAVDLNGAALSTTITANDFDVTNSVAAGSTIAVDLRGTTGAQAIQLGDAGASGAVATIAGVNTGVWLDAATDAAFVYGDGESAIDGTSTISAVTGINAAAAPAVGSYNFRDVTFGASPGLGFGVGRTWFVDSDGATGGGNGSGADGANPMLLAAAELALAATDVIVLINNGSAISAAGSNGNDTLALLSNAQVRGFGQGPLALMLTVPLTIQLSNTTINIADPTGQGAATLTSAAGANVITLGASGNRISGFILDGAPAGALRGIVDNGGATGTVVDFMTIRNFNAVGGYGVEITPSTNTTIDNVTFTGNTNDVLLNAAGSTLTNLSTNGATGTSITIDNATGTTTLTNVSITGAATGLSFTNAGNTINATNVDINGAATSALTISGGTASFNFDGASSIVQAAGGLALNFTGNHTAGTFAFGGTINATSGAGMQFSNADGVYNFTGLTTLNGGNAGIDIYNGAAGTFAFGSATSLTHNGAGNAFVLLSSANVTFDGTIVDNDGLAVEIDGHDGGTATFNGAISSSIANASTVISVVNSNGGAINFNGAMNLASTATVVSLSGNDGGTITFNAGGSGLDITSTSGTGMIITGGGTVNVQGGGNSITTTSGTLLSITNTGATTTTANLAFATASNTSGANGVFVQRTAGALGGTVNIGGGAITATTRGVALAGDALDFSYGGTLTTSGVASRAFEATTRTGGTVALSGNLTDTSLGLNIANNTGGTINFTGQTISLSTGANAGVTLSGNTGATVNFTPLAGGNGLDIVTTGGAGFSATGGGTVTVSGTGNSIQTATGQVINLTGVTAGSSGINFASLQNTGTVAGIAINLNNLDSSGGGAFSGGTTSVAATSGGNDGIFIGNGSAANVSFGATTIGTGTISGDGIEVNGSGNGAVTFTSVDIDNTTAHGVSIVGAAGATGAVSINGGTIGAGGAGSITGDGVNITGGGGSVTVAASIAKTNAGNVVEVSNHAAGTVTFSNNISATGGAANGILLSNNSGGTITFSGATKTLNTGGNNAIQFDNTAGTGAAVSFTGGNLDIDTSTGRGITATSTTAGAGSLTITGTNNTITSAGGIALNLVNTNIGAGGLNFLSISANGGARGIVLNTTGGAGGLTVTGTGTTDGSGGTIQNITQRGIELLDTALVNIANLNLTNASTTGQAAGQDLDLTTANGAIYMNGVATAVFNNINITGTIADNGITGIDVANFQLNNSLIDGAGDGANESGIEFNNLSGTSSLTNTEIRFSETNSLDIVNTDRNLNLTLDNVIFRDTQTVSSGGAANGNGEGGLQFRSFSAAAGSPTTNIDIINSDFLRLRTQGIQIIGEDDSTVSVDIVNNTIASQADIGAGIDINGNDTATVNFNVNTNTIQSQGGHSVNITSFLDSNVMGRIIGNTITANGSGGGGSGVRVVAQETSQTIVSINTNNITAGAANNSSMIDLQARFDTARLDATVNGNTIDSDATALANINVTSGSSTAGESNQVYVDILNNIIVAGGPTNLIRYRVSDLSNTNRVFLTGFVEGGAGVEDDVVATWNAKGNTPGVTAGTVTVSLTGTAIGPVAGTALTPSNPLP